jgi:transposase
MDSHKRSTQLERLELVETGRRRRWSDDEKLRIVTESFEAPRAISSTARRHGISRSLLMTWRRAFGPEPIGAQSEQSGFARVVPAAEVEPAVAATPSGQMVIVVGRDRAIDLSPNLQASVTFNPHWLAFTRSPSDEGRFVGLVELVRHGPY